jgi:hypothetical protein
MRRRICWLAGTLLALVSPLHAGSLSGTWTGGGPDLAVMLQLVESGGRVVGRYEQDQLQAGPKIVALNASVKGSADGETIALEVKPAEALSGMFILSGSVNSGVITLSGGGFGATFNLTLSRSSEDAFRTQTAALTNRVAKINATTAVEADIRQLASVSEKMKTYNITAAGERKKVPLIEDRFRAQTKIMTSVLEKQQSVIRIDRTAVIRGQLDSAINQAANDANQLHADFRSTRSEFESRSIKLLNDAVALSGRCQTANDNLDKERQPFLAWKNSCSQLLGIATEFRANATQMLTLLAHAESTWQEEDQKQRAIIQTSNVASR